MNEFIFFLLGSFIFYLSYFITGQFIYERIYSKSKIINFYEATLLGLFTISLLAIIINFFFPLSNVINLSILCVSLCLILFLKKKRFIKIIKYSFYFTVILIIFTIYARNAEDASLYHLSFISILNEDKINFGLSNFHSRFGHISIIQYLSAVSFIPLLSKYIIISQNNFIFCLITTILVKKFYVNLIRNEIYNSCINFLFLTFICLKIAKFSDWGNDLFPLIATFYIVSYLIDFLNRDYEKENFNSIYLYLLLIITFIFFSKISYVVIYSLILLLFFKEKNIYKYFNYKILLTVTILILVLIIRNFISTSCIIYPLPFSCIETLWYPDEISKIFLEAKSWSMGISDVKNKIDPEIFIKDFNWVYTWLNNHFYKVLEKIFSFLFFAIFLIFLINYIFKFEKKIHQIPKFHYFLLFLFFFYVLFWFISAPLFRYGAGLIITLIILLVSPFFSRFFNVGSNKKKIYNFTIIIVVLTISVKNIIRITNNSENNLIPKTFNEKKLNSITINGFEIFYEDGKECFYPKYSPCIKHQPNHIKNIVNFGKYKIYIN